MLFVKMSMMVMFLLLQPLTVKQTVYSYEEAMVMSKYKHQKVVVFVGCDVVEFVDSNQTVIVHLEKNPIHAAWQSYKDGVLIGEWKGEEFAVEKFVAKKDVDSTLLLTKEVRQQLPTQYADCPSCQQQYLNKLRLFKK